MLANLGSDDETSSSNQAAAAAGGPSRTTENSMSEVDDIGTHNWLLPYTLSHVIWT